MGESKIKSSKSRCIAPLTQEELQDWNMDTQNNYLTERLVTLSDGVYTNRNRLSIL